MALIQRAASAGSCPSCRSTFDYHLPKWSWCKGEQPPENAQAHRPGLPRKLPPNGETLRPPRSAAGDCSGLLGLRLLAAINLQQLLWVLDVQLRETAPAADRGRQNALLDAFEDPCLGVLFDLDLEGAFVVAPV